MVANDKKRGSLHRGKEEVEERKGTCIHKCLEFTKLSRGGLDFQTLVGYFLHANHLEVKVQVANVHVV